jgi:hypothetical protein
MAPAKVFQVLLECAGTLKHANKPLNCDRIGWEVYGIAERIVEGSPTSQTTHVRADRVGNCVNHQTLRVFVQESVRLRSQFR